MVIAMDVLWIRFYDLAGLDVRLPCAACPRVGDHVCHDGRTWRVAAVEHHMADPKQYFREPQMIHIRLSRDAVTE